MGTEWILDITQCDLVAFMAALTLGLSTYRGKESVSGRVYLECLGCMILNGNKPSLWRNHGTSWKYIDKNINIFIMCKCICSYHTSCLCRHALPFLFLTNIWYFVSTPRVPYTLQCVRNIFPQQILKKVLIDILWFYNYKNRKWKWKEG